MNQHLLAILCSLAAVVFCLALFCLSEWRDKRRWKASTRMLAKCVFCGLVEGQPDHDYCGHRVVIYVEAE